MLGGQGAVMPWFHEISANSDQYGFVYMRPVLNSDWYEVFTRHGTNHPLESILHVSIIHQLGMLQRHLLTVYAQNKYLRPIYFELSSC